MSEWIIKITGANMPASCRARYRIVRVLEVADGVEDVHSVRSKAVIRVVYESVAVPAAGVTERSGLQKALAKARALVDNRADIEANARDAAAAAARRRAEIEQREHTVSIESRRAFQDMIVAKLDRGEPLTEAEFASL
jgi:hypothetical protein